MYSWSSSRIPPNSSKYRARIGLGVSIIAEPRIIVMSRGQYDRYPSLVQSGELNRFEWSGAAG